MDGRWPRRFAVAAVVSCFAAWPSVAAAQAAPAASQQGRVLEDSLWSQSLGTRKRVLVWLPPSYASNLERRYPVAFYLHGVWGDETDWTRVGRLDRTLDSLARAGLPEMIVVMPDGDDGWYSTWNWLGDVAACRRQRPASAEAAPRYCVPWPHYDDYIARDLVAWVDGHYRTMRGRRHRGIAGLSMGGYGAVALALSYPEVFGAAASHSGLLAPLAQARSGVPRYASSIDSLRAAYELRLWESMLPVFGKDTIAWLSRDPAHKAARLQARRAQIMPALFADCGTDDAYLGQNRFFREQMSRLGVPVEYAEWPGGHSWDYWRRHAAESVTWLARRLNMP